ncbi:AraC family transcriptional regulator [Paenibacillus sp. RC67]|uniref:helix-turn-helix domain-containing protein n=1 Tax=Paenibacillus sp. RC67 TaxID=3039392 RepID=UPI0024AE5158|nr:AraC family transcriptional regulator [Paenibacillus sp. RC67]
MSNRYTPYTSVQGLEQLLGEMLAKAYVIRIMASYNVSVSTNWLIRERMLDDFHMLYVVSGSGTYIVEDMAVELTQNNVLFISNQVRHQAFRNKDIPFRIIPLRFRLYAPKDEKWITDRADRFYLHFTPRNGFAMQQLFEKIHTYNQLQPSVIKETLCHSAVAETLASLLLELEGLNRPYPLHPGLSKIKQAIDEHPAERYSQRELADIASLSPKYVSALFHQVFGLPLKEYEIRTRMEYAEYLLKHSNHSVKELANLLGYPDPYSFSKQFKQYRGYSPSSVILSTRGGDR